MIGVSFTPDSGGAYLLETKLTQPVAATDDAILRLAAEIPPDATFPTGSVGGAGMLVPARYEGGDLVSVYSPGQSIDLPTAIGNFGRQLNGEAVSDPYIFSPNTRRFLVQDGALIGWQTMLFAPAEFSIVPASSLVMAQNGDSPRFYDGAGLPSLGGWYQDITDGITNFFNSDAPMWQKAAVGGVAAIGTAITGVLAFKAVVAASGLAAAVLAIKTLGAYTASVVGTYLATVAVSSLGYAYDKLSDGYLRSQQGGSMPESLVGKVGYGFGQTVNAAAATGRAIQNIQKGGTEAYNDALRFLKAKSDEISSRLDQYASWLGALRPWLIGGGVAALGLLAYQLYTRRGR